ncbi:MAG: LysR family transcriptional regulator, partial [Solirubrobacteraceae bacterium]
MIDLRRLRALRELANRGTIAAAADALYLTPSAVSQQLASLEQQVGQPLLIPNGRTVRLTPAAEAVLGHADAVFSELERMDATLAALAGGERGRVRIGSFATGIVGLV